MPGLSVARRAVARSPDPEIVVVRRVERAKPFGRNPYDWAACILLIGLAFVASATLADYGISNDEEVQHRYGELILSYYASGFTDRSLFAYRNLYLYGGLFDVLAVLAAKLLPFDVYLIRHGLSAAFGLGGIAAVWATARWAAGPRAGLIAAALLALTAQWYGPMFNHTKDVPFAAAMIGASYFLLRAIRDLPEPRWSDLIWFGVLAGAACGLRALGLLLFGYAGLAVLVHLAPHTQRSWTQAGVAAARLASRFLPAFALAYAIMVAAWPWAALSPLNPLRAIFAFSHFQYEIRTIFAGEMFTMAEVPRWYVPAYLAIRLPLALWAGAIFAGALALWSTLGRLHAPAFPARAETGWLWFFVAFPLACEVAAQGPAFTGMRHFLFVVPPLAVLAGIGFDAAIALLAARWRRCATPAALLLAALLVWEGSVLVRLHPHQYLYYNGLVGGLPGAAGRYVTDYWVNAMPEAVGALERYIERIDPGGQAYLVGVCGERFSFEHEANARLRWSDGWWEADFFIAPTHMNCHSANNGRVVARIERLGTVIAVVKDRRGFPPPNAEK